MEIKERFCFLKNVILNKIGIYSIYLVAVAVMLSCRATPYYSKTVNTWKNKAPSDSAASYSVYLIGDAGGTAHHGKRTTLKLLQSFIEKDSGSALVFLGDNIYHDGLPSPSAPDRKDAENKLNDQLDITKNYKGKVYFISGNHDWDYMKEDGYEKIVFQENYIEEYLDRGNTFIPDNACPGPFHTLLSRNILLIAIDSQWWLHKYEKPYGRRGECEVVDETDMLVQLEDLIRNNQNKHILLVAHHPLFSNGNHGGYYNVLDYVFPLRLIRNRWYFPLPVIGSVYPLFRKFGGVDQDLAHYRYQEYRDQVVKIIRKFPNVIYAAGHDHNLQLHKIESMSHIVSGSGSKTNPVRGGDNALYTQKEHGFAVVRYYPNGQAWVEFWTPFDNSEQGLLAFRYLLYTRKSGALESYCSLSAIDYSDSIVSVAATRKYKTSDFGKILFGHHYRKEWQTPIKVPMLDMRTEEGGLIPYGIGGGKQSVSLKLKNLNSQEFVLRSVNKDPTKAVPPDFRNTFLHELVDDQISAQHPYGALIVPRLADAIGVLHTNPRLALIPNDSCLGPYRERFKNMLAIFEEDPDENHEDKASLGFSKNIVGTDRMREKIEEDEDNKVDQKNFLRARLLDMLIGDWDRHERQYRWAEIETEKGILFQAVPEDRDQAFFKFDGVVPYFMSRRWTIRNLKDFDYEFHDIKGLNASPRFIDRRYLTELSREDWEEITASVQKAVTDTIIEMAVKELPPEIFAIHGPEITAKLKSRRDLLRETALRYYDILAKYVDVFGTDKKEKFLVERTENHTKVSVYHIKKDGEEEKIYERNFSTKLTEEIRLYGLGGDDAFYIMGVVKKGTLIRIIGGEGEDTLSDASTVRASGRRSVYYDTKENTIIKQCKDCITRLDQEEIINYPNQDQFFYNFTGPRVTLGYNPDDGLYLGGGILHKKYKFRASPYGSLHKLMFSRALQTGATLLEYTGDFKQIGNDLNLEIEHQMYTPQFVMNFFGFGNESVRLDVDNRFYRVRLEEIKFTASIYKEFKKYLTAGLGPRYQYFKPERNLGTFLGEQMQNGEFYSSRHYAGMHAYLNLGTRDNEINPTRGIMLTGEIFYNKRIDKNEYYAKLKSDFSFYITPNIPFQLTFASRIGHAINYGAYEFYQANALGGTLGFGNLNGNLRGHLRTRFIGDRSFYHNNEIRVQLARFRTYIFPLHLGILGLFDYGRVWERGVKSNVWHYGYGGGIWLNTFNRFVTTATYSLSEDDRVINVGVGFLF